MIYTNSFPITFQPQADPRAIIIGDDYRFSVLTGRLLRLEYNPTGEFDDRPSQTFWFRKQDVPDIGIETVEGVVRITTDYLVLTYHLNSGGFTGNSLQIYLKGTGETWHFGDTDLLNLGGTARTLDEADGAIPLERGLLSRRGWSVVDDSQALVFDQNGWLVPRGSHESYLDIYFFGYGANYTTCLADFTRIAGNTPLPPRFALGNWWSRYWAYSANELLELMLCFKQECIPLSVCIVDMDWHITDTGNESSGWTGYTWNRDLFPNPASFLEQLHDMGLKTALNLHPADGIHPHEAVYPQFAQEMGLDPKSEMPIPFDIANPDFVRTYFELLHHPQEADGVDFWWLDWQQGTQTRLQGLDPLWWLNHLHYYDLGLSGQKRPFIFSRWGGLGNHRYPIGFSGDTVVSWESLAFQPYFTSTASNVGFGWWSHDIGGHMGGVEDPELYSRWVQFGVFSPIFRLHSTNNPYHERRPWGYDAETLRITRRAMQLRHALVPYLYSMAWQFNQHASAPVKPMYYGWPEDERSYHCPDQYGFGSELVVAPYVSPRNGQTRMSRQVVWLPPGDWFGFFDDLHYPGDAWHVLHGRLEDIPVFAKAGAIIPLARNITEFGTALPTDFDVHIYPGANNSFELYEDDEIGCASITPLHVEWDTNSLAFELGPVKGEKDHLPTHRAFTLHFHSLQQGRLRIDCGSADLEVSRRYDPKLCKWIVGPIQLVPNERLRIVITSDSEPLIVRQDYRLPKAEQLLACCRLESYIKLKLAARLYTIAAQLDRLKAFSLLVEPAILQALLEILGGVGVYEYRHPGDRQPRVLCWNNRKLPKMQYQLSGLTRWGERLENRSGVVSPFAALLPSDPGVKWLEIQGNNNSDVTVEDLPLKSCKLALDFCGIMRVGIDRLPKAAVK